MTLCPIANCGKHDAIAFKNEGKSESFEMFLEPGQACSYSVRTECGSLAFLPEAKDTNGLHIYTIDYEELEVGYETPSSAFSPPILIPGNNTALTSEDISHQYYYSNYTTFYLKNGS
jgi:hypothetical protein